jgi:hypothetical protein
MNLAEKINSVCKNIEEMSEMNSVVEANEESIKLAELVSQQIVLIIDNLEGIEHSTINDIKELQDKYLQNPKQIVNWTRIELFEALLLFEKIKRQMNSRN